MKENNPLSPHSELATLANSLFVIISSIVGLLLMIGAFLIDLDPKVRDPSILKWQFAIGQEILIAIGTSILASVCFYLLYSRTAENRVLREVSVQVTRVATEYATSLFKEHFDKMMPAKIYPQTNVPSKGFNDDFDDLLKDSKTYKYKGDAASYTAFRLHLMSQRGNLLEKEIKILLLDPREISLFEGRAQMELSSKSYSKAELTEYASTLRIKVYVTLVALFDICHSVRVEVGFHKEHLFFRSEIFDDGLFLTYYLGGEFPSTYLYTRKTLSYDAFLLNFWQNYNDSAATFVFNNQLTEDEFKSHLHLLGCTLSIEDLRNEMNESFKKHRQLLSSMV